MVERLRIACRRCMWVRFPASTDIARCPSCGAQGRAWLWRCRPWTPPTNQEPRRG